MYLRTSAPELGPLLRRRTFHALGDHRHVVAHEDRHAAADVDRMGAGFVAPTLEDRETAVARLADYPDQAITLCDVLTAALSEELDLPVWTYDHHFEVMVSHVWR